jgi:hypothetical protein
MTLLHNVFTRFFGTCKILFAVPLKHYSAWPSADVKSMSNDLVHTVTWQCMFSLSLYILKPFLYANFLHSIFVWWFLS